MSDHNTAALAEHEHKTDRDQERRDMWARSAASSANPRILREDF